MSLRHRVHMERTAKDKNVIFKAQFLTSAEVSDTVLLSRSLFFDI